ncbi:MAG: septum formation protein Maf [Marmoricola sp.]|nr:septum formation protein Maf [Marmoricola sp.]
MTGLVLASASPARLATLRAAGVEPTVVVSGVDESQVVEPDPARLVVRLAELKGRAVRQRLGADGAGWLLACDSMLDLDGEALGKPADAADAVRRWQRMRGRSGVLRTGHYLLDLAGGTELVRSVATTVHFADVDDDEVAAYVATGEPLAVAGAFTVDGLGGAYVTGIEGDHHNVVGLSLPALREMFAELGVAWRDLRS